MRTMHLDRRQGVTADGRDFGYVCGDDGGWFFTWHDTLEETVDSLEIDEQDGDGGLDEEDVRDWLKDKLAGDFSDEEGVLEITE